MYFLINVYVVGLIKIGLLLIYKEEIRMFCKFIETPPFLPDLNRSGELEFLYVKEAIRTSNTQAYAFIGIASAVISQMLYDALSNPGYTESFFDATLNVTRSKRIRSLPFNTKLAFETIDSPYYEIACIYGIVSGAIFGYSVGIMDALICGIMCHIRAQLLILEECLRSYIPRGIYLMASIFYTLYNSCAVLSYCLINKYLQSYISN